MCSEQMGVSVAVVTETWLKDKPPLDQDRMDLSLGAGLGLIARNRPVLENGVSYEGVAVIWREGHCNF